MNIPNEYTAWLARTTWGKRERAKSYLFMPFSQKVADNVVLYTPQRFDHWVEVEWSFDIVTFNEQPPIVEIPCEKRLERVQFDMACLDRSDRFFLRRLVSQKTFSEPFEAAIDRWGSEAGLEVERIDVETFSSEAHRHENKKELLHFIRAAQDDPLLNSEDQLHDFVCRNPGATVAQAQVRFSDIDPTTVIAILGKLMIQGRVKANLNARPFDRNLALAPK